MSDPSSPSSFARFGHLPVEIRLMIWEQTWPGSRVIELAYAQPTRARGGDASESRLGSERVRLRPTCRLSAFLRMDFADRGLLDEPLERCPDPAALHVCGESRAHTLAAFERLHCGAGEPGGFYFSPRHDVLWLSRDVTYRPETLHRLGDEYGEQLRRVQNALVLDHEWSFLNGYARRFLSGFPGLRTVHILLEHYESAESDPRSVEASLLKMTSDHVFQDRPKIVAWEWLVKYMDRTCKVYGQFRSGERAEPQLVPALTSSTHN